MSLKKDLPNLKILKLIKFQYKRANVCSVISKRILKNPKTVFALLIIAILSFGYYSKDFRLDASSETLLIEGDPDLAYLKRSNRRYGSKDFLILTYTPNEGMVTDNSINNLLSLKYKIQSLNWVHSVITLIRYTSFK